MRETLAQNSSPMSKPFFRRSKLLSHLGNIPIAQILEFTSLATPSRLVEAVRRTCELRLAPAPDL